MSDLYHGEYPTVDWQATAEAAQARATAAEAKVAVLRAMMVDDPEDIAAGIPWPVIEAGMQAAERCDHDLANYVSGETPDWDQGMICAAIFKAMARAALQETAIGPD